MTTLAPVGADQHSEFQRNGHVVVRGVAAHDLDKVRAAIRPFADRAAGRAAVTTYDKAFLQLFNLWCTNETMRQFALSTVYARIAASLLGVERVRLYHDQALIKVGHGGHTPWHQDQRYWPLDGYRTVTMWMALVDCTPDMGTMRFVSGSHRCADGTDNDLGDLPISDQSEALLQRWIDRSGHTVTDPTVMRAGDASFHTGWTVHGAPPNGTAAAREAMTVIYMEDGAHACEPTTLERRNDLAMWMPGVTPGGLVDSPLNPVLC
jgi:ectoine hydroxylase-related dioxygenase (phytanoyl-CoA dioxygenase family)